MTNQPPHSVSIRLTQPAMEALLGASPELKVQLTAQVCEEFAKRHVLKCVENNPEIKQLLARIDACAQAELIRKIGKYHYSGDKLTLQPYVLEKLQKEVNAAAENLLDSLVNNAVKNIQDKISTIVDRKVDVRVNDLINSKLNELFVKYRDEIAKKLSGS